MQMRLRPNMDPLDPIVDNNRNLYEPAIPGNFILFSFYFERYVSLYLDGNS